MTITPHPICGFNIRSQSANPNASPRSSGIHLSAILRSMALAYGKLPAEYGLRSVTDIINSTSPSTAGQTSSLLKMALGMAWEDWIAKQIPVYWPGFLHQPGEFSRDGITGTPDGISFSAIGSPQIHEFKLTWKSMNRKIEDEWLWLSQITGYAALVSDAFNDPVTEAFLHVNYVMGDYSRGPDSGCKYCVYRLDMEPVEVNRAWEVFVQNKDQAEPEIWDKEAATTITHQVPSECDRVAGSAAQILRFITQLNPS